MKKEAKPRYDEETLNLMISHMDRWNDSNRSYDTAWLVLYSGEGNGRYTYGRTGFPTEKVFYNDFVHRAEIARANGIDVSNKEIEVAFLLMPRFIVENYSYRSDYTKYYPRIPEEQLLKIKTSNNLTWEVASLSAVTHESPIKFLQKDEPKRSSIIGHVYPIKSALELYLEVVNEGPPSEVTYPEHCGSCCCG